MENIIKHFMWGYQQHFQVTVMQELQSLLTALNLSDTCDVFLVGVHEQGLEDSMPGCVEPEVNHWARSEWFYDAFTKAKRVAANLPEAQAVHSHPVAQENADRHRLRKAIRRVVRERLNRAETKPADTELFLSFPILRDQHWVMLVVSLPTETVTSVPAMSQRAIREGEYDEHEIAASILKAVIESLFTVAGQQLHVPDAGAGFCLTGGTDEILRRASYRIVNACLAAQAQDDLYAGEGSALLDAIERLSWTPYESAEARGQLAVVNRGFDAIACELCLVDSVPVAQIKSMRKLLSLTDASVFLVVQPDEEMPGRRAIGLAELEALPDDVIDDVIKVSVHGRSDWEWSVGDKPLVRFRNGLPELPTPEVDISDLANELKRRVPAMPCLVADQYASIGSRLAESNHGALLVVLRDAETEAKRLSRDGMRIVPKRLTEEYAEKFARIDGATLCDTGGICHAVGVILDGQAVGNGDRGRGSRYNSALRYVRSLDGPAAAMICSEDGGLTLTPPFDAV